MTDFEEFQSEFLKWQERFGLMGYITYFKHEPLESFADISVDTAAMRATVRLNSRLSKTDKPHQDARYSAKHEALHLLVVKLEHLARQRYVSENEIYRETEELVNRLSRLIPDEEQGARPGKEEQDRLDRKILALLEGK
jgi:hypothetical protein